MSTPDAHDTQSTPPTALRQPPHRRPSAEDIAWVGLWPACLILIAALLWLAPQLSGLQPGPSIRFFPEWQSIDIIKPEPTETTRFLLALLTPFVLTGAVLLGSDRAPSRKFDPAVVALQIVGIALIVWAVAEQVDGPFPPFVPDAPGYFQTLLLSVPVLLGGAAFGIVTTIVLLAGRRPFARLEISTRVSSRWRLGALCAALALTALWLLPAIVTDANVSASGLIPAEHIPTQADDFFAVVNGRTPLVNYIPQYVNLLSIPSAPVLKAFGLSLTSFSVLMTILSLASLLAIYGAFCQVTERPLPALALYLPFLALSLFPWADHGLVREFNGSYYGFFPGRYLGPFVVAGMCALAVRRRRLPVWLLFFGAGLAALNNAEFGVPSLLALVAALLLGSDRSDWSRQAARAAVLQSVFGLGIAVGLVCGVILARTGVLPDFTLLTFYSRLFARESFGLEPMPTLGLHIPMYLTYVAAILTAAVRHVRAERDQTLTAMLAYAGVLGLLGCAYFAGRSLPWQLMLLFPLWGFALALLAWAAYLSLRTDRPGRRAILPSLAAICGFGVMVAAIVTFPPPWEQIDRISQSGPTVNDAAETQTYVERHTVPGEAIVLFGTPIDHRVAERAQVRNVSPWNSVISLFSKDEVARAVDELEQAGGSKIIFRRGPGGGLLADQGSVTKLLRADGFHQELGTRTSHLVLFERR